MARESTTSEAPRSSLCPSLPPEIWITIFCNCHDLSHLWNTCRHVSPTLKACAERAFSTHHLSHVQIEFLLDRHNLGGKRGPHEPAITLGFERVGKGHEEGVAWFTGHFRGHKVVDAGMRDRTEGVIMQRWHENVRNRKPELPNYTISIGGMVNDTHIPDLVIENEGYKVRLGWRGMLDMFFREQARLEHSKEKRGYQHPSASPTEAVNKAKGRKPATTALTSSWHDTESDVRRDIRRARLIEHYSTNAEMIWAIGSLKYFEKADSAKWSSASPQMLPHLPGAGLGERWFGSTNVVQELYLDECSSMNRIDTQMRAVIKEKEG